MAEIIPLQPVPNQTLTVSLSNQTCQIDIIQRMSGLYLTLSVNNSIIISNVLCENGNLIVRDAYLGFVGDLAFIDNTATDNPDYLGLGTRFSLAYIPPEELP